MWKPMDKKYVNKEIYKETNNLIKSELSEDSSKEKKRKECKKWKMPFTGRRMKNMKVVDE